MIALLLLAAAHAACPNATKAADVATAIDDAERAYVAMDLDSFNAKATAASAALPCLADLLTDTQAAKAHRISALHAYVQRDHDGTVTRFRAALFANPQLDLPTTLAPQGNLLRNLFDTARAKGTGAVEQVEAPDSVRFVVNGQIRKERPAEFPVIVQITHTAGAVIWSADLAPDAPFPSWEELGVTESQPEPMAPAPALESPATTRRSTKPRTPILLAAGGAAVVSSTLYAAALYNKAHYVDPDSNFQTLDELQMLHERTNMLAYSSIGVGVIAVGLGTAAFLEVRW